MPRGGSVGSGFGGGGRGAAEGIGRGEGGEGGGYGNAKDANDRGSRGGDSANYGGEGGGGGGDTADRQDRARETRAKEQAEQQQRSDAQAFLDAAARDVASKTGNKKSSDADDQEVITRAVHDILTPRRKSPGYEDLSLDERIREAIALDAQLTGGEPTDPSSVLMGLLSVFVPGLGALIKGAQVLNEALNQEQHPLGAFLEAQQRDSGGGGEGGEAGATGTDTSTGTTQPQQTEPEPAQLLTQLQELGTRNYLNTLRTQNDSLDAKAAEATPTLSAAPLDLYTDLMRQQRERQMVVLDSLIGLDYGRIR